jgi:radical S-adenosyl methionine domain-containing protein 2
MGKCRIAVINLHLLEGCNFYCRHCFAQFGTKHILSLDGWKRIIDNILQKSVIERFNLAGGEPLLYPAINALIDYIVSKGIKVSIITNGSLLTPESIRYFADKVAMIGLSIDTVEPTLSRTIGRCTGKGEVLPVTKCIESCKAILDYGISLKINTVISRLNLNDDISDFIRQVQPDRWKVLKMKVFSNADFDNSDLVISDAEFSKVCQRYAPLHPICEKTLTSAYIFVDPSGNLIDNSVQGNQLAGNLLQEDFLECFYRLPFNKELYARRYLE